MAYIDKYGVQFTNDRKTLIKCPTDFSGKYVIPDCVTIIENKAFFECVGLQHVTIPQSVKYIGRMAFGRCIGLTDVVIPSPKIEEYAFDGCDNLKTIIIGINVKNIGHEAFSDCYALTSINVLSENANYSSEGGVLFNKSYTTLVQYPTGKKGDYVIPNSVTHIGHYAFSDCNALTNVIIPSSVTHIGYMAFASCSSLTRICIPEHVTSIGEDAFRGCSGITSVIWDAINCRDCGNFNNQIESFAFGREVETIPAFCCKGLAKLVAITIPNKVTSIGNEAFRGCYSLKTISMSNSIVSVGERSFYNCSRLMSITFPNSVIRIGREAFYDCRNLISINIPNGVTSIEEGAFENCVGLNSLTIPNSVTNIGEYAFCRVANIVYYGSATGSPWRAKSVNGYVDGCLVYKDNSKTTLLACSAVAKGDMIIPNSVTSIGREAFSGCSYLTSIIIPNSVTSIGKEAFSGVANIIYYGSATGSPWRAKSVNGYVDGYLVYRDSSKTTLLACSATAQGDIIIPNSVTSIGREAFYDCTDLTSITIPNGITYI